MNRLLSGAFIHSFSDPISNIIFDEYLFNAANQGRCHEVLRFWESPVPFVVLGRISKIEEDLNVKTIAEDHVAVLRRCSGGGTVVQGPGCFNFSFVLSKSDRSGLDDIKESYEYILSRICDVLIGLGVKAKLHPISDIAVGQGSDAMKISGNAQKRGKNYILHHGTLLLDFQLPLISKYLAMPKAMPDYRQAREHDRFVENIGIDKDVFCEKLLNAFNLKWKTDFIQDFVDNGDFMSFCQVQARKVLQTLE